MIELVEVDENLVVDEKAGVVDEKNLAVDERAGVVDEKNLVVDEKAGVVDEKNLVVDEKAGVVDEKNLAVDERAGVVDEKAGVVDERNLVVCSCAYDEEAAANAGWAHGSVPALKVSRCVSMRLVSLTALVGVLGVVGCGDGSADEDGVLPGSSQPEDDGGNGERPDAGEGSDGGSDAPDGSEGEADAGSDAALPDGGEEDLDGGDGPPDADAGAGEGGDGLPDGGGDDHAPVSLAASMATGRSGHAAVRLEDGRVVVMSGKKNPAIRGRRSRSSIRRARPGRRLR